MHATKPNCIDHRPVVEFERGVQYYIHMFIYDIHVYNDTYERWNQGQSVNHILIWLNSIILRTICPKFESCIYTYMCMYI